jgi:hypothetical protein
MPIIPGFSRRRGQDSDTDLRRHSFYLTESASNPTIISGRASEQIPRRPSAAELLSPSAATTAAIPSPVITRTSADHDAGSGERAVSPPVQEETPKHHRFSMLKFRHASDSQLSTRARMQAQTVPPIPHRENQHHSTSL